MNKVPKTGQALADRLRLPYQKKRRRTTEQYIERLRDRLTRAELDVAWACRSGAVLSAMMLHEERRRRDGLDRLRADIEALDGEWDEPKEWSVRVPGLDDEPWAA